MTSLFYIQLETPGDRGLTLWVVAELELEPGPDSRLPLKGQQEILTDSLRGSDRAELASPSPACTGPSLPIHTPTLGLSPTWRSWRKGTEAWESDQND